MQGFRAAILECFHDSRRNCKGIWKRSSFYRLGRGGGGGGGAGGTMKQKTLILFSKCLFAFTSSYRNFIKKRETQQERTVLARIARTRIFII